MKISDGINYAIQQALAEDLEKTAADEATPDPGDRGMGSLLRQAAASVRENETDKTASRALSKALKSVGKKKKPELPSYTKRRNPDLENPWGEKKVDLDKAPGSTGPFHPYGKEQKG